MLKTLLTCSTLFFCTISQADEIDYCRVTSVNDGNSFRCTSDKNQNFEVTLHRVDTPKLSQPYGKEAKALLSAIILNKKIDVLEVEFKNKQTDDGYQRIAATLWAYVAEEDGVVDINQFMIAKGLATYDYSSSLDKQKTYIALEEDAKKAKLGLWSQSDSAPPVKEGKTDKRVAAEYISYDMTCENKEHFMLSFPTSDPYENYDVLQDAILEHKGEKISLKHIFASIGPLYRGDGWEFVLNGSLCMLDHPEARSAIFKIENKDKQILCNIVSVKKLTPQKVPLKRCFY